MISNSSKESFSLGYRKINVPTKEILEQLVSSNSDESYEPFKIENIQNYNPVYGEIFQLSSKNYNSISLNHPKQFMFSDSLSNDVKMDDCFIKYSPLLDPFRYLTGKYNIEDKSLKILPTIDGKSSHPKLINPNNASYIDNFFCYLSSQLLNHHLFPNAIDYYGSFLGIQEKFRVNIADDIEHLRSSDFFMVQKDRLYEMEDSEEVSFMNFGSRKNKAKLAFHNESNISQISVENLDSNVESSASFNDDELEKIYENEETDDNQTSDDSSNNSETNYTSSEEEEEEEQEEEEEEDEEEEQEGQEDGDEEEEQEEQEEEDIPLFAYIHQFPIQMICLESCKGTMDGLLEEGELDEDKAASALMQIIMTLIVFQKAYHFTHNDLHTNNIMYIETDLEFLYYKFNKKVYRIPTYGKIYKIIDFGRAIYQFNGKIYCSDSFAPDGDANSQYNFEPYLNSKKPRLEPNYSFDLCRLGCSIFDFILDETYENDVNEIDELQRTIIRWCSDDNGKNVLYKRTGEERYPNFKLYKMIARTVHGHTPESQLNDPYFKQFMLSEKKTKAIPDPSQIINIDDIPCYA